MTNNQPAQTNLRSLEPNLATTWSTDTCEVLRRGVDVDVDAARLEAHADAVFSRISHYRGAGLWNHCHRVR
jgi:hypothetical protein